MGCKWVLWSGSTPTGFTIAYSVNSRRKGRQRYNQSHEFHYAAHRGAVRAHATGRGGALRTEEWRVDSHGDGEVRARDNEIRGCTVPVWVYVTATDRLGVL